MKYFFTLTICLITSFSSSQTKTEVAQTETLKKVLKQLKEKNLEGLDTYIDSKVIEKTDLEKLSEKLTSVISAFESINVIYLSGKNIFHCQYFKDGGTAFEVKFYFEMYDEKSKIVDIVFE